jgi:hypothetical protein
MGLAHRDADSADFRVLKQIATACNSLQHFSPSTSSCNSLQPIATTTGTKHPSQTPENPVVEHKGIVRRELGFGDLLRGC